MSSVRTDVRITIVAAVVGCIGAGPAAADVEVGVGLIAQATRYGDQPNRNVGGTLQVGFAHADWRYFAELGVLAVSLGPEVADGTVGTMSRAAIGLHHRARTFELGRVRFELGFEGLAAIEVLRWTHGDAEHRPELAAGFTWTFVLFERIAARTSIRAFVTPAPGVAPACRGDCSSPDAATSGYMVVTGVAW